MYGEQKSVASRVNNIHSPRWSGRLFRQAGYVIRHPDQSGSVYAFIRLQLSIYAIHLCIVVLHGRHVQ